MEVFQRHVTVRIWFSRGLYSFGLMAGLEDLRELFQSEWFYVSMIVYEMNLERYRILREVSREALKVMKWEGLTFISLGKWLINSPFFIHFVPVSSLTAICHTHLLITSGRNFFVFFSLCHLSPRDLTLSPRRRIQKELRYTDIFNHWITMQDKEIGI